MLFLTLFALCLVCDLALKDWAMEHLATESAARPLIPKLLALKWTQNEGAIFGAMKGKRYFFIGASLAATALILFYFSQSRSREWGVHLGLSLILAGAMGNLYDRIEHGFVRDMLFLFPGVKLPFGWEWGRGIDELYPWIFNLADVYLLIGIAIVVIGSFRSRKHEPASPVQGAPASSAKP